MFNPLIHKIMAKIYGNNVRTGRVGGSVFSVLHGQTIERQYQPIVLNPKSTKQVETRAAFKLLTQLSATMKNAIAFRRLGLVSPRNRFVAANKAIVEATIGADSNVQAEISMLDIDLTGSLSYLPGLSAPVTAGDTVTLKLSGPAPTAVDRVFYALYVMKEGGEVYEMGTVVAETAGIDRDFQTTINLDAGTTGKFVAYAYGVTFLTSAALTKYQKLRVDATESVALLSVIRTMSMGDVELTVTRSAVFTVA